MALDPASDLFTALRAIWTADGGDNPTTGGLRGPLPDGTTVWVRDIDRYYTDVEKYTPPEILVEILQTTENTFSLDHCNAQAVFHLFIEEDRLISEESVILERIRVLYDKQALAGTDWSWSLMQMDAPIERPKVERMRHVTVVIRTMGNRAAGGSKRLFGRSCGVTFTAGSGGESIVNNEVKVVIEEEGNELILCTPWGSDNKRYEAGVGDGSVQLYLNVDDSNPEGSSMPIGVIGTLVILKDRTVAAHGKMAGPFVFSNRQRISQTDELSKGQRYIYSGRWTVDYSQTPSVMTETL